jgi:P27 family predicted phage terminase small subunit
MFAQQCRKKRWVVPARRYRGEYISGEVPPRTGPRAILHIRVPESQKHRFTQKEILNLTKSSKPKKDANASVKAPSHLSADSKLFFDYVIHEYTAGFDRHHVKLLTLSCEALDRGVQARKLIEKDGLTFVDRHGSIKPHAAVAIEKDSRIAFARMIREIGLDIADSDSRPPTLPANKKGNAHAN